MNNNKVSRGKQFMKRIKNIPTDRRTMHLRDTVGGLERFYPTYYRIQERIEMQVEENTPCKTKYEEENKVLCKRIENQIKMNFILNSTPKIKRNNVKIFDIDAIKSNKNKRKRWETKNNLQEKGDNLFSVEQCECCTNRGEQLEEKKIEYSVAQQKRKYNQRSTYHIYSLLGIQSPKLCFTLRDKTLYTVYRSYEMMDTLKFSSFLYKMSEFNFINILFGLKIFRSYLNCPSHESEQFDRLFVVSTLIASKYLDDKHVINEWIPERLWLVNGLEIQILSTLGYTIEIDIEDVNNLMYELFYRKD